MFGFFCEERSPMASNVSTVYINVKVRGDFIASGADEAVLNDLQKWEMKMMKLGGLYLVTSSGRRRFRGIWAPSRRVSVSGSTFCAGCPPYNGSKFKAFYGSWGIGPCYPLGDAVRYVTKCSGEGIYFAAKSGRMCAEAVVEGSENGTRMINEADLRTYMKKFDQTY